MRLAVALRDETIAGQRIFFGARGDALATLQPKDPLFVVGSRRSVALLDDAGLEAFGPLERFTGATPHNPEAVVERARAVADHLHPKTIVAIGSSSAIDLGKALAFQRQTTLVSIPTALGGAEMSRGFGILHPDGRKAGNALAAPSAVVIYDAVLLESLGPEALGSIGLNAFAHTIEARYAKNAHVLGVAAAERGGRLLGALLPQAAVRRDDELHRGLFEAAYLAGFALNACGMGLHHATCHVLGGSTGLPHGIVNAVVLPHAVRANAELAPQAVGAVADAFGIPDLAAHAESIARAFALPRTLAERGARADIIGPAVASIAQSPLLQNNPAPVPESSIERVVRAAVLG